MPDAQNVVLPSPAPQAQQAQPGPRQAHKTQKAHKANQAGPSYKHIGKEPDAAKDDGQDNAFTSFMALLNEVSNQSNQSNQPGRPETAGKMEGAFSQAFDPQVSGGIAEDAFPAGKTPVFSKPVMDLMASLKNGLEKEDADVNALSEEMSEALNVLGLDASDLQAIEAMLAKLREANAAQGGDGLTEKTEKTGKAENDGAQDIKTTPLNPGKPEPGLAGPALETPIAADGDDDVQEEPEVSAEAGQMGNAAVLNAPPQQEGQSGGKADAQPQPLAVSKFHAYLKPDAAKESAAQDVKPAADNAGDKSAKSQPAGAVQVNPEAQSGEELSGGPGNGQEEKQQGARRDAPVRSAQARENREAPDADKDIDAPKAKTNFTENRPAFEQFFNAAARRDPAAPAPQLELGRSFSQPLSQGDALNEGLGNVVRFIRANGEQRANLIVDPPAIGRVSVELTSTATGLEASIKVSSEQVRQLIQDHLTQLKLSLEQQGVQLTHFSVDVQQDDARRNQEQSRKNSRRRAGAAGIDEDDTLEEDALFRVDLNQGLLYWVA